MAERRFVILANGNLPASEDLAGLLSAGDILIAADGGAEHAAAAGLTPHTIIGDLDSISPRLLARLEAGGTQVLRFPTRKNETDLDLAIQYALDRGAEKILLLAALGARWDMTLSNFFLLARWEIDPPGDNSPRITILDGRQEIFLILPGRKYTLKGETGDTVSLIPLAGEVTGVITGDLEYPLYAETLPLGSTRGVSNVMLESHASVEIRSGKCLCFLSHHKGESAGGIS